MSSDLSTVGSFLYDISKRVGALPFDLAVPSVPGSDLINYETVNLFRRYGSGEGRISEDRQYFSFKGEVFMMNEQRDGRVEGAYRFLVPLSSTKETPPAPKPPFTLETLSIREISPQASSKEKWDFGDKSSLTLVGPALLHSAEMPTGVTTFWTSGMQFVTNGSGRFEGARGVKTSSLCILIPSGESLENATRVRFKTIDVFIVLRKEFIGELKISLPGA